MKAMNKMNKTKPTFFSSKKMVINLIKSFPDEAMQIPMKITLLENVKKGSRVNSIIIITMNAKCNKIRASSAHSGKNSKHLDKR